MKLGDVVSVRYQGRYFLGRVVGGTGSVATVEFLTAVPAIDGRRLKKRSFPTEAFREHGRAGVSYIVDTRRERVS